MLQVYWVQGILLSRNAGGLCTFYKGLRNLDGEGSDAQGESLLFWGLRVWVQGVLLPPQLPQQQERQPETPKPKL